ncbi:MFS transporter [Streptomyces spinoverrucosus]|uniref:MFS transporter n=1 Tax=Streptomyces spinoverrucosus TaxID=284043 RepID=A0A4Y3VK20_9ACTN|nr:MFS transporter [Streptomyces spinoverrucosus]GEC07392.1 MFS transporter [Streptomyces spinoverrucosus]GHB54909.1 MFS transporter [Streptomyces spinoverrucosus]
MNATTTAIRPTDRRAATIVLACLGVFVAYLPVTTVAVSLPAIQRALSTSTAQLSWAQDAFVLPMAAFIMTAGVFGDVHGRKKVFQAGLFFCAAGAAVALCAHNIQTLWAGQALAGLGSAALLPTTLAMISHAVPDFRERGKYIGMWAMAMLAALAVGPVIAGVILDHFAWRWIYLLSIPVSLVAMVVAAPLLTDSRAPHGRKLDWPGQITAAVGVTALVYGVIEGGADSFTATKVVAALALGVAALVAFVLVERRSASPMLDLAVFRSAAFTATAMVALIMFLGLIGFFFVLSLYFGMVQQLGTLQAGARLLLVPVAAMVAGAPAGRLMHRVPAGWMITVGLLLAAGALLAMTNLDADTSYGSIAWRLIVLGVGLGLVTTPMTATAVAAVPHHLAGMASAANNAFRQVGGALGPAVLGALLSTRAVDALPGHLADAGITGAQAHTIVDTAKEGGLGAVAGLDLGSTAQQIYGALGDSLLDGMRLCLVVAATLALIAALCAVVLLRRPKQQAPVGAAKAGSAARHGRPTASAENAQADTAQPAGHRRG